MKRLTYMSCDFNTVDRNGGMSFDEDSFSRYLASERFQKQLKGKKLFGALSHKVRSDYQSFVSNNYNCAVGTASDFILADGKEANFIDDVQIKDHKLYITIVTIPYGDGLRLEKLIDLGVELEVSMSVKLHISDGKYYIDELLGLDVTTSPAFSTYLANMSSFNEEEPVK